jgi:hypothetical protein
VSNEGRWEWESFPENIVVYLIEIFKSGEDIFDDYPLWSSKTPALKNIKPDSNRLSAIFSSDKLS